MHVSRPRRHSVAAPTSGRILAIAALVVLLGASAATAAPTTPLAPPATRATAGGWQTAPAASLGMDASALAEACEWALEPERHTQGVVVIREGTLVEECYGPEEGPRSWAASWSVGKSFASTLIGIAIDRGEIPNLDVSMADYFDDWVGTPKAAMTLRDVVTMSSGLEWNENYTPTDAMESDVIKMGLEADQLAYAKSRPLVNTPGTVWKYSSGDAMLLSGVIAEATGRSAGDYAQEVLFGPLGMEQVEWWTDAVGHTLTYCCVDTTTRDFARLGHLFLNDGNWNGNQIVSASWVAQAWSTVPASDGAYGYMWWFSHLPGLDEPIPTARGFDGQFVFVIPSLDLVIARNGDYVKSACPAVGDPNLFTRYPPSNLIPGQGTRPPESWSQTEFLTRIVDAVTGDAPGTMAFPDPEPDPGERFPDGQATAPCDDHGSTTTTTVAVDPDDPPLRPTPTGTAPPAAPVVAHPTYTG